MRYTDIAIVGGGLGGSSTAATLGQRGIATILIDPNPAYPFDFRCEKFHGGQLDILRKTGLADALLRATTHDGEIWIGRFGRVVDRKPSQQFSLMYDDIVNTIRAEVGGSAETIHAKATAIATSDDRQQVTLSDGSAVSARLVVLASGLNMGVRHSLGIGRNIVSRCHSVSLGFDIAPTGQPGFPFPAMTYFSERASARAGYITLFPIGDRMRANLFVYRDFDDPWLREFRQAPERVLHELMPGLRAITGAFDVRGPINIRPADLYVSEDYRQAGVVLVGDAFTCVCPATGAGTDKVFTDVERLCNVHIPAWLATEGMAASKIAAFYDDPVKTACDDWAMAQSFSFKSVSIERGLYWSAQRWARFLLRSGEGFARRLRPGAKAAALKPVHSAGVTTDHSRAA
jgi:2-polyprenyl-6-methoxyphenol hydroxylase-like FAD-dependent oxidoreductase